MESNGYIGAVQMTLNHSSDFEIELTDDAFIGEAQLQKEQQQH